MYYIQYLLQILNEIKYMILSRIPGPHLCQNSYYNYLILNIKYGLELYSALV